MAPSTPTVYANAKRPRFISNSVKMYCGTVSGVPPSPSPAASRRRPSRKMQNERHAAWERCFLKETSATLHGNAFFLNHEPSTGPDRARRPKRQPKATQGDAQDRKKESAAYRKIKRRSAETKKQDFE